MGKAFTEESTTGTVLLGRLASTRVVVGSQEVLAQARDATEEFKNRAMVLISDPQFKTCTFATATGTVTFGTAGGAFGLASGVVVGSTVGVVPALISFGMSIPVGAVIGGTGGLFSGILIGGSAGGVCGYEVYKYRVQIKEGVVSVKLKTVTAVRSVKDNAMLFGHDAQWKLGETIRVAKSKALAIIDSATSTRAGVTSTAAAGGAVVGGVTGGVAGAVAGTVVGIVPAVFTFGLSIPIAATAGLCLGCVTGGSAGAVGGATVGYGGFTYQKELTQGTKAVWAKAKATIASAKRATKQD